MIEMEKRKWKKAIFSKIIEKNTKLIKETVQN